MHNASALNVNVFESVNDAYCSILRDLLKHGNVGVVTQHGATREWLGASLQIHNVNLKAPYVTEQTRRAPTSYTVAEFLWTVLGTKNCSIMLPYAPSFATNYGDKGGLECAWAYGSRIELQLPRLCKNLEKALATGVSDRRLVMSVYDGNADLYTPGYVVPCCTTFQFFVFGRLLSMETHMRSQDAWVGLAFDMGVGMMLQQLIAGTYNLSASKYIHTIGSLHLYEKHWERASETAANWEFGNKHHGAPQWVPSFRPSAKSDYDSCNGHAYMLRCAHVVKDAIFNFNARSESLGYTLEHALVLPSGWRDCMCILLAPLIRESDEVLVAMLKSYVTQDVLPHLVFKKERVS